MTGSVTYGMAIPIIMGQNIGTCVTALLSSIGVSRSAKQVSVIHISFNLIGTAVGLLVICGGGLLFDMPFLKNRRKLSEPMRTSWIFTRTASAAILSSFPSMALRRMT